MLKITDEEFAVITDILDGYCIRLDEFDKSSDDYEWLKYELDNKFCGLEILREKDMLHAELNIGNVMIENNILTCIYDNNIHKFNMVKRKAKNGEYAYIVEATDCTPFNKKYIGRCFTVHSQPTKEELEWMSDHVGVHLEGLYTGWCLYDCQYVVLEEI